MEGPITLQPVFAIREYEVLVSKSGNGTISGEGNYTFDDNGSNLISANPDAGWYFDKWADDGNISSLSSPTSATPQLTLPLSGPTKQSLSFTAEFVQSTHQLDLNVSEGNGSIALTVDGVNRSESNSSISESLLSLLEVSVEANASEDLNLNDGWDYPTVHNFTQVPNLPYLAPMQRFHFSQALISIFLQSLLRKIFIYLLKMFPVREMEMAHCIYEYAQIVNVSAIANDHYYFESWSGDTEHLVYDSETQINQILMPPDSNVTITPIFKPVVYTLSISSDFNGSVEVNATNQSDLLDNFSVDANDSIEKEFNATIRINLYAQSDNPDVMEFQKWEITKNGGTSYDYWDQNLSIDPHLDGNYSIKAFFYRNSIYYF